MSYYWFQTTQLLLNINRRAIRVNFHMPLYLLFIFYHNVADEKLILVITFYLWLSVFLFMLLKMIWKFINIHKLIAWWVKAYVCWGLIFHDYVYLLQNFYIIWNFIWSCFIKIFFLFFLIYCYVKYIFPLDFMNKKDLKT